MVTLIVDTETGGHRVVNTAADAGDVRDSMTSHTLLRSSQLSRQVSSSRKSSLEKVFIVGSLHGREYSW